MGSSLLVGRRACAPWDAPCYRRPPSVVRRPRCVFLLHCGDVVNVLTKCLCTKLFVWLTPLKHVVSRNQGSLPNKLFYPQTVGLWGWTARQRRGSRHPWPRVAQGADDAGAAAGTATTDTATKPGSASALVYERLGVQTSTQTARIPPPFAHFGAQTPAKTAVSGCLSTIMRGRLHTGRHLGASMTAYSRPLEDPSQAPRGPPTQERRPAGDMHFADRLRQASSAK